MSVSRKQLAEELAGQAALSATSAHDRCAQPGCRNEASSSRTIGDKFVCPDCWFDAFEKLTGQCPTDHLASRGSCH